MCDSTFVVVTCVRVSRQLTLSSQAGEAVINHSLHLCYYMCV